MEATTYHLKNTPHMHDQFERIPEGTKKKIFLNSRRHLSAIARESERESHFQHPEHILCNDTNMALTSFQYYCLMSDMNFFNMERIGMSSMGSTTSLFRCSKQMDSYVVGTRQSIGQTEGNDDALK
jgi:hypothetical protein